MKLKNHKSSLCQNKGKPSSMLAMSRLTKPRKEPANLHTRCWGKCQSWWVPQCCGQYRQHSQGYASTNEVCGAAYTVNVYCSLMWSCAVRHTSTQIFRWHSDDHSHPTVAWLLLLCWYHINKAFRKCRLHQRSCQMASNSWHEAKGGHRIIMFSQPWAI